MSRYQTLRRLLIKISYTSPFPPELFLSTAPPHLTLPILSHLFLSYSPVLTAHLLSSGFLLSSSSFSLSALYGLLHAVFGYHPQLSQQQFSSERGYVERKLQLLCDVLQMCVAKAEELEREKGIVRGGGGSGSKGGVPRVTTIVREQRRSTGEEHKEKVEQRSQRQTSAVRTKRQEEREEQKVEEREDGQGDESGSPLVQHQHVSFTHDDSSQPLSPSHLSPLSNSQRTPHRTSQPSQSYSLSQSAPSNTAASDPLLTLHQQLHRVSHRTNQLAHTQQPDSSEQNSQMERLVERVQVIETSVRDELCELRKEVHEMRQRLTAIEQRDREREQRDATKQVKVAVEQAKEAGSTEAERVTSGGAAVSANALPSDMSEFLTHMNDRLSLTAKLLESSRRARGRPSEGE